MEETPVSAEMLGMESFHLMPLTVTSRISPNFSTTQSSVRHVSLSTLGMARGTQTKHFVSGVSPC